ncbi:phage protein [Bacillus cereus]|nr:phage protein [Bacillus cereus]
MNLIELKKILDATGYPVAYSHFTVFPNNPVPKPPYICFIADGSANLMADNKVYHKINDLNIELYTTKKDLVAEAKLEKILDDLEIPYDSPIEGVIESEKMYQKIYETRLI